MKTTALSRPHEAVSFFVPGVPRALSVGTTRRVGRKVYQGRRNNEWADHIGRVAWQQYVGMRPMDGPVSMTISAYVPRPKRVADDFPIRRPDLDNLIHKITDRFIGLFYHDDAQIVRLSAWKRYADGRPPGLDITVEEER